MKILITGGSGFLGWHLTGRASQSHQVFASFFHHPVKFKKAESIPLDLRKRDDVLKTVSLCRPQAVIHTAALTDVDFCEENQELARKVNVDGTRYLAEAAEEAGARLVFCSSDMVFDGRKGFYKETDRVHPLNFYGRTKVQGEEIVREVCSDYLIARVSIIYGWGSPFYRSFADKLLEGFRAGKEAVLFKDQVRTPIHTDDLSEALLEIAGKDIKGLLHLGGSERISRYDFGRRFAEKFDCDLKLVKEGSLSGHHLKAERPEDCSMDVTKAEAVLGRRFMNIDEGLNRMKKCGRHIL
jgi:dTDP-4-dehydrorhamnose reductase